MTIKSEHRSAMEGLMEAMNEVGQWDLPAIFGFVQDDNQIAMLAAPDIPGVPPGADAVDIANYLRALHEHGGFALPRPVVAVMLVVEGWGLAAKPEEKSDLLAEAEVLREVGMRIADHPESREIRMIHLADSEGCETLMHARGDDKFRASGGGELEGRAPEAVKALYRQVAGS